MTRFTLEPLDLDRNLPVVHSWVTHPRSSSWMMQDASLADVHDEYARIAAEPHHDALLGRADGRPAFLVETYDPAYDACAGLAGLPELRQGDLGMHVLVAPPDGPGVAGFTTAVFAAVMEHCLSDPAVQRVVVEPDTRNTKIRAKNVAAGFVELREVSLEHKTAMLSVCTRQAYLDAAQGAHLRPGTMAAAQRHLVAKALSEFAHERLITPRPSDRGWVVEAGPSSYTFTARVHPLEHWVIEEESVARTVAGQAAALDAQDLIAELAPALGVPDDLLPVYLEEIAATLASAAWKRTASTTPVADLVGADYQTIEGAMTEGHPAFVANNGRIGFGIDDYLAFAPETARPVRMHWLAVRREQARLSLAGGLSEERLYATELGATRIDRFRRRLEVLDLDPDDYLFMPVHPWQWRNKLAVTFAPDVARRDLVHLGEGEDDYRAQQSIRTFFNLSRPERHYVKTALSIQNMGFLRGLSPAYMAATPAINDWVAATVAADPELTACGFSVLREVAAIGYTGDAFHRHGEPSAHRRMVAALWRESPIPRLAQGERLATMACLLHRDAAGDAMVTALVKASPLDAEAWVRTYLRAYLRPLVHCLLAYEMAFMPHSENLVMVLHDHVPIRMIMKDIGEEVAIMGDLPLPAGVERIRASVPEDMRALAIHTDVMDGVLRYVAALLDEDGMLESDSFWAIAREVIEEHAADHPELAQTAARYDLLRPEFRHSCLNRLQLRNTRQMVDITDQASSLAFAGMLRNPLAEA